MNGTALNKTDLAAWRSLLARPDASALLVAATLYLVSSLILPLATNESLCLLFVVACAAFYYMQTRTISSLILPAIPAMLLFTLGGSMMLPAAFFAIVFGGTSGAMLLLSARTVRHDAVLVLLPVAAYTGAILLGASPAVACLALFPLPVAVVAALAVRRCTAFTSAVAILSGVIGAGLLAALLIPLAINGLLDVSLLPAFVDTLGDTLIAMLEEATALYAEAGVTIEISEMAIRNLLSELINLSPAILALVAMVTAYFTWRILCVLLTSFGMLPRLPRIMVIPTMSVIAACLFLIAYLTALVANAEAVTPVGAVALNLSLILEPGLALVGVGNLLRRDAPRSCFSLLALVLLVYLVWSNPATALALAAFFGALHVLLLAYQNTKNRKGEQ